MSHRFLFLAPFFLKAPPSFEVGRRRERPINEVTKNNNDASAIFLTQIEESPAWGTSDDDDNIVVGMVVAAFLLISFKFFFDARFANMRISQLSQKVLKKMTPFLVQRLAAKKAIIKSFI